MDYLGTTEKPLTHIGKLLQFEGRATDPESTEEGDLWLRVDLAPEDHQLATFRFDAGTEIWDIPVLEAGSSHADVEEVLPVDIGGELGYVPVADRAEVAYPQLGFRHDGTTFGLHDFSDLFDPTYFEVRDINAPAEVDPEEPFTTTAIIDNTNGRLDTQTIEHEFDNAVVNTEAVELEDDTYQVSFEYSHTEEGSFTNAIYSEDDFDSMEVQVGDAIPDSVVHHYPINAGSGSTLTDGVGSADASLNGGTWDNNSQWYDSWAINFDGIDDYAVIDNNRTSIGDQGAVAITAESSTWEPASGSQGAVFGHADSGNEIVLLIASGSFNPRIADNTVVANESLSTDTKYRMVLTWDSGDAWAFLNNNQVGSASYSGSVNGTEMPWYIAARDGSGDWILDMYADNLHIADQSWNSQTVADDYNNQPWS